MPQEKPRNLFLKTIQNLKHREINVLYNSFCISDLV